jgi:hypothetical protein
MLKTKQTKDKNMRLLHKKQYHLEIMYETEFGFTFTSAIGDTLPEVINDGRKTIKWVQANGEKNPQIMGVYVYGKELKNNNTLSKIILKEVTTKVIK